MASLYSSWEGADVTNLEYLQQQLRDTREALEVTRKWAAENPQSDAHRFSLRAIEKRRRSLQERIDRA